MNDIVHFAFIVIRYIKDVWIIKYPTNQSLEDKLLDLQPFEMRQINRRLKRLVRFTHNS